jgi:nuclear transport factor 2 (NTF2) superfamily protein
MVPDYLRQSQDQVWELQELIGEGVQRLEHACLAQCTVVGTDRRLQWVLTRRGRSAIADGSVTEALAKLA